MQEDVDRQRMAAPTKTYFYVKIEFHTVSLLKVDINTEQYTDRTRIYLAVHTSVYFRIEAVIRSDGNGILYSGIQTSRQTVVFSSLEEILKGISQCDIIYLQKEAFGCNNPTGAVFLGNWY